MSRVVELGEPDEVTAAVLAWGAPRLRDLPWRQTRDPWAVLVSEVMLQQTQADRVVPKWRAFLDEFPSAHACARRPLGDVLRLWHGLGYPRRARSLHLSAQRIVDAGSFPDTIEDLLALPGVGPYTARAVLAFAFERDVAVVDTNIARVLARLAGKRLTQGEVQRLADSLVPVGDGWLWNQILMDLGATRCRPTPECSTCPLRAWCRWHADGLPGDTDPSVGSASVSAPQGRFAGSERQARGRLMAALVAAAQPCAAVPAVMGRDAATAQRLLAAMVREGLVVVDGDRVRLP